MLEMLKTLDMDADLAQHRVDAVVHGLEVSELPRHTARLRPAPRPRPRAAAGQPVVPPVIEPDSMKLLSIAAHLISNTLSNSQLTCRQQP